MSMLSEQKPLSEKIYSYRYDIDGLRGIAVIAVVIFHLNESWLPGGFTGVDIFFVISGYVVTGSILRHSHKSFFDYIVGFYKRRILRLMPALLGCMLITVLVTALFIRPGESAPVYSAAGRALLGWSNNYFVTVGGDYFGIGTQLNPLTHTWSLGVEEQFYLIFPIVLFLAYGLRRPVTNKRTGVWILVGLTVASALWSLSLSANNSVRAYYLMPSRFWEMASGVLVFLTLTAWPKLVAPTRINWIALGIQFLSVGLIIYGLVAVSSTRNFPLPWALPTVIGTVLFLVSGLSDASYLNQLVAYPAFTYLGKISYSLYLWHWPVFTLFRWTIGLESTLRILLALCITTMLSIASYYCLEQPVRNLKLLRSRHIFALALTGIFFVGTASVALAKPFHGNLYLAKTYYNQQWWPAKNSPIIEGSEVSESNCHMGLDDPNEQIVTIEQIDRCTAAAEPASAPHIFLVGDSHAFSLVPMLGELRNKSDFSVTAVTSSGCLISSTVLRNRFDGNGPHLQCRNYVTSMLSLLEENLRPGDIVLIASRYRAYIGDEPPIARLDVENHNSERGYLFKDGERISRIEAREQVAQDLMKIAERFSQKEVSLIIQAPVPEQALRADQCLPTWFSAGSSLKPECFVERKKNLEHRQSSMDMLNDVQSVAENAYIWDPFDALCPDKKCSHFQEDKPLFRDDDHLSEYGSKKLALHFTDFLNRAISKL